MLDTCVLTVFVEMYSSTAIWRSVCPREQPQHLELSYGQAMPVARWAVWFRQRDAEYLGQSVDLGAQWGDAHPVGVCGGARDRRVAERVLDGPVPAAASRGCGDS